MPHVPGHIAPPIGETTPLDELRPDLSGITFPGQTKPADDEPPADNGPFDRFEPGTGRPGDAADKFQEQQREEPVVPEPIGLEPDVTTQTSTITPPAGAGLPFDVAPVVADTKELQLDKKVEPPKLPDATDVDKTLNAGLEADADDIDQIAMDFIKQMIEGDDPIAELAFNWQMQQLGPIFSAANDNLTLKLKQQGISGTNAGNAWLSNMARQQGVQVSDIVNRINFDSAQRIQEWNRYGPERAKAILSGRLNYKIDKYDFGMQQINDLQALGDVDPQSYINIGAANGLTITPETAEFIASNIASENEADVSAALREINNNYRAVELDLEAQVPGIAIDGSALASLTPDQQADVRARIKEVNQAIKSNDVATAQSLMQELKELYPNTIVGEYAEWNPADFRTHADNVAIQTFKADAKLLLDQNDPDAAAKILVDKVIDPLTVESTFADLWATTSPERRAELIAAAGLDGEPITADDKAQILAHDMLNGMTKTTTDEIFKAYFNNAKGVEIDGIPLQQWLLEPENETLTRSWIFQVTSGPYEIDENGLIVPKAGQQLPPWNPDSNNAHFFTDWGMADSFDPETGEINVTYTGNNAYEDDNEFQTSEGYMNYRGQMDDAWESYVKGGGDLTRQEWFEDVKPVWDGSGVVFNGEAEERGTEDVDPLLEFTEASQEEFDTAIKSGDFSGMTEDEWFSVFGNNPGALTALIDSGQVDSFTGADINSNAIIRNADFRALGLRADVEIDNDPDRSGKEPDIGVGDGKGSIVIIDGRPARVVVWTSDKKSVTGPGADSRKGNIWVEFLDEDPATREAVRVGGSPDFVDI